MPKIIENLREQLLAEAEKQVTQQGYTNTTMRSVASACGVGVGTVYNYFESKEMLIATFVFEHWKKYLCYMETLPTDDAKLRLGGIYDSLQRFAREHERLFSDSDAAKLVAMGAPKRHQLLRDQIAHLVLPLCRGDQIDHPEFAAKVIAESLICWSMENADFEMLYPLLEKTIKI